MKPLLALLLTLSLHSGASEAVSGNASMGTAARPLKNGPPARITAGESCHRQLNFVGRHSRGNKSRYDKAGAVKTRSVAQPCTPSAYKAERVDRRNDYWWFDSTAPDNFSRLADAVYLAEGGSKAKVPYGILSVKTSNPRRTCLITIEHAYQRWVAHNRRGYFIDALANRYCPPSVDSIGNMNWRHNVKAILKQSTKRKVG